MLAAGASSGCSDIFLLFIDLFSFSLSLGDSSIQTELLSQSTIKPKSTNQQKKKNADIQIHKMQNAMSPLFDHCHKTEPNQKLDA